METFFLSTLCSCEAMAEAKAKAKGPCCAGPIRKKKEATLSLVMSASRPAQERQMVRFTSIPFQLILVQVASALGIWPFASIRGVGKKKRTRFQAVHGVIHPSPLRVSIDFIRLFIREGHGDGLATGWPCIYSTLQIWTRYPQINPDGEMMLRWNR